MFVLTLSNCQNTFCQTLEDSFSDRCMDESNIGSFTKNWRYRRYLPDHDKKNVTIRRLNWRVGAGLVPWKSTEKRKWIADGSKPNFATSFAFRCTSPTSTVQQIFVTISFAFDDFLNFFHIFQEEHQHVAIFGPIFAETWSKICRNFKDYRERLPNAENLKNIAKKLTRVRFELDTIRQLGQNSVLTRN